MEHRCAPAHNARRVRTSPAPGPGAGPFETIIFRGPRKPGLPSGTWRRSALHICAYPAGTPVCSHYYAYFGLAARRPAPSARCPGHHGGCACAPPPSCPRWRPFLCQREPMARSGRGGRIIPVTRGIKRPGRSLPWAGSAGTCSATLHTFPAEGGGRDDAGQHNELCKPKSLPKGRVRVGSANVASARADALFKKYYCRKSNCISENILLCLIMEISRLGGFS